MLKFIFGGIALAVVFMVWCCCRVAGEADAAEEEMLRKWTEEQASEAE